MLMSRRNCVSLVVMAVVSLASAGVVVSGVLAPAGPEVASECGSCQGSGTQNFACNFCKGTGVLNGQKCFNCKGKGFPPCIFCNGTGKNY